MVRYTVHALRKHLTKTVDATLVKLLLWEKH